MCTGVRRPGVIERDHPLVLVAELDLGSPGEHLVAVEITHSFRRSRAGHSVTEEGGHALVVSWLCDGNSLRHLVVFDNASVTFVGEYVRVLEGRFADFCGEVRSVDAGSRVAVVSVVLFGRETPVEVSIDQLEAVERPNSKSPDRPRDPTDILDD